MHCDFIAHIKTILKFLAAGKAKDLQTSYELSDRREDGCNAAAQKRRWMQSKTCQNLCPSPLSRLKKRSWSSVHMTLNTRWHHPSQRTLCWATRPLCLHFSNYPLRGFLFLCKTKSRADWNSSQTSSARNSQTWKIMPK